MFGFILGTSPVFFALTYLATALGSLAEKYFTRIAAVALLLFGVITLESGLNLTGSPYTLSAIPVAVMRAFQPAEVASSPQGLPTPAGPLAEVPTQAAGSEAHLITINAKNNGYSPSQLIAPADSSIELTVVTKKTRSCSRAFEIPALGYSVLLPETGEEKVEIPPQPAGTELRFTCSMGMYTGVIHFQ
jgi:hypothetical protein